MEAQRVLRMRELFDQARAVPEEDRDRFLTFACAEDTELRKEVGRLLAAVDQAGSFLEKPAAPRSVLDPVADVPAERIGPYRLVRELGRGGMGIVYLAVRDDGTFTKKVALKLLQETFRHSEALSRFRAERQVLAGFDHPNIARILDAGDTESGDPYYVMEYVEGEPIDAYCQRKGIDLEAKIALFQQLCAAVDYLHCKEVVHRDLKPSNILVAAGGAVKLLDFGIAKFFGVGAIELTVGPSPLTPMYASPEQRAGLPVGRASDVYSLGLILYRLLTGALPNPLKIEVPSASLPSEATHLRRRMTGDLDMIVVKALSQDPDRRYSSPADFSDDLQRFLDDRTVLARPTPLPARIGKFLGRNRVRAALTVVLLLLTGGGSWLAVQGARERAEISAKEAQIQRLLDATARLTPPTADFDPSSIERILADVRALRASLESAWLESTSPKGNQARLRQAVLDRSSRYLDSLRRLSDASPSLAVEVSNTYLRLGDLQQDAIQPQFANRSAAVANFTAAAQTLARAAGKEPQDTTLLGRLRDVEHRLVNLEAQLPPEVVAALRPKPSDTVETAPPARPARSVKARPSMRKPDQTDFEASAAHGDQRDVLDRLSIVAARVEATEELAAKIRSDLAGQGLVPRPEIEADVSRMRTLLEQAKTQFARGDYTGAGSTLQIVEALATRVSKVYGR